MVSILCKHDINQKVEIFIDEILMCSVSYNGVTRLKNIDLSSGMHKVYIRQVSSINKWYWLLTSLNPKEWQWLFNIGLNFNWYEEGRYVGYNWNYAQMSFELDVDNSNQELKIKNNRLAR